MKEMNFVNFIKLKLYQNIFSRFKSTNKNLYIYQILKKSNNKIEKIK